MYDEFYLWQTALKYPFEIFYDKPATLIIRFGFGRVAATEKPKFEMPPKWQEKNFWNITFIDTILVATVSLGVIISFISKMVTLCARKRRAERSQTRTRRPPTVKQIEYRYDRPTREQGTILPSTLPPRIIEKVKKRRRDEKTCEPVVTSRIEREIPLWQADSDLSLN